MKPVNSLMKHIYDGNHLINDLPINANQDNSEPWNSAVVVAKIVF